MGRIAEGVDKVSQSILVALALASLTWAGIALFYPVKISFLSGILGSGRIYQTSFNTYAYNSLGGFLLVLAGLVNSFSSIEHFRGKYDALRSFLWALFSAALVASIRFVGDTIIVSWSSNIPAEIQHAIGTPYVKLTELPVKNIPMLVGMGFATTYIVLVAVYCGFRWWKRG